jgi:hypothetical protein
MARHGIPLPCFRLALGCVNPAHDAKDFDPGFRHIVKHPDLLNAQPILWLGHAPKPLDATLALPGRFEGEVPVDGIPHCRPLMRREGKEVLASFRRKRDIVLHSGLITANSWP